MTTPKKPRVKKPKAEPASSNALVRITVPKGCKRTGLSVNALDSYTRKLALKTVITANGQPLFCDSFKLTDRGTVLVEIRPESFEISEAAQ